MRFARHFRLSDAPGAGVRCDENGAFVGDTPLLERVADPGRRDAWRPRPLAELDRDLGKAYGLPVSFAAKLGGLASVARALDRGDVAHAQVATLLLQLPDPLATASATRPTNVIPDPPDRGGPGDSPDIRDSGANAAARFDAGDALNGDRQGASEKYNRNHDEHGRFATASGAVIPGASRNKSPKGNAAASGGGKRTETNVGHADANSTRVSGDDDPGGVERVSLNLLTCRDAFRACAQIAAFQRPGLISGCMAALSVCKSTGLPTIFGPGIVGQQ
jgi:hypothetical protein